MNCVDVRGEIPFYCYGELGSELEERMESHLAECSQCRLELARHRAFLESLDKRDDVAAPALVTECRADLRRQLAAQTLTETQRNSWSGWLSGLRNFTQLHIPMRVPVGAMALFALGWFAARYTPEQFGGIRAGMQPMFSSVKSIEPASAGKIHIALDEVQRRVVTGSLDDPRIQQLLLNAVREESNPGVRVESIRALQNSTDSEEVRRALIDAVSRDPNPGVRLKALEGLKQYTADATVRKTLANVLLTDDNAGVRLQAIDLLTTHRDDSIVGVLQDVMEKEDDGYIRTKCRNLLEAMRASVGTY